MVFDGTMSIGDDSTVDDSQKTVAMVAAGTINVIVAPRAIVDKLDVSGFITPPDHVLSSEQRERLSDALIDRHGSPASGSTAIGLDLSKSARWQAHTDLPGDAVLAFANVSSGTQYPRRLVDFMQFEGAT